MRPIYFFSDLVGFDSDMWVVLAVIGGATAVVLGVLRVIESRG